MIFRYAFEPQAILGGGFGYALKTALSQGAKRGLFSNEAGMGSTPHAHAQAHVKSPHEQGVVAMIGVFMDTFVVLTLNALVIISTLYTPDGPLANGYTGSVTGILGKSNLAQAAFGTVFGSRFGAIFVAVCLFFFAFSTVLSWNLFGKINAIYLFGRKNAKVSTAVYTLIALVFIFLGTLMSNDLVWELVERKNSEDIHKAELPKFLFRVVDFMECRTEWVGTATELLTEMKEQEVTPNMVTKYLGQFAYEVLEPLGIEYRTKRTGKSRLIKFLRRDGDDANDAGIAI